jgi:hypothetical protein
MFPPMSPLTERVRTELENQQFEREVSLRAQFSEKGSVFHRLRTVFAALGQRTAPVNSRSTEPYPNSQLPEPKAHSSGVFKMQP